MTRSGIILPWLLSLTAISPLWAGEAGDVVFAERGPWALADRQIIWKVDVDGPDAPGFLHVTNGEITLSETIDPSDQQPVLQLIQKTDQRERTIGPFPISAGDPALTFFLEQTTRDMASLTGGSPFYIRNRIKDALFRGGKISRQDAVLTAEFHPFAHDPNAARMNGFETLTLTFVMTDPKSPIREMRAATSGDQPGYDNRMVLE